MDDFARYLAPIAAVVLFVALVRRRDRLPAGRPAWRDARVLVLMSAIAVAFVVAVLVGDG